jgi:hypothetical protein
MQQFAGGGVCKWCDKAALASTKGLNSNEVRIP